MKILKKKTILCPCCMEEHEVLWVEVQEEIIWHGRPVSYLARYMVCERDTDSGLFEDEDMIEHNVKNLMNAVRRKEHVYEDNRCCERCS